MSLKDAIREAVDERHKQESSSVNATAAPEPRVELPNAELPSGTIPIHELTSTERPKDKIVTVNETKEDSRQNSSFKAANTASNKAVFAASSNAVNESRKNDEIGEDTVETAAMTVRVPRQHRIHWLISAKKQGTSLTAAITEALNARFGEPSTKDG